MPMSCKSFSDMMQSAGRSTSASRNTGKYLDRPSSSRRCSILPSNGHPPPPPPPRPAPPPPLLEPTPRLPALSSWRAFARRPWASPPPYSPEPQLLALPCVIHCRMASRQRGAVVMSSRFRIGFTQTVESLQVDWGCGGKKQPPATCYQYRTA